MIELLFYGLDSSDALFEEYMSLNQNTYSVAHRLFEKAIVDELASDSFFHITHQFIWQGKSKNKIIKGRQFIGKNIDATLLKFINLPIIKFISIFISCFFTNLKWVITKKNKCDFCIISSINYVPVAFANYLFSKLFRVKNYVILTDTSISNAYTVERHNMKRLIMGSYKRFVEFLEKNYDGYVFLSKYMNEQINNENKPWCLVEGIFNPMELDFSPVKKKNVIMHAGTLNKNLGVDKLIEGFKKVHDKDVELWIFGTGNYVEQMKQDIKMDDRIKYFGFVSRKEIFTLEKQSILLINTRDPKEEYTKFSFPSKTMEYMASGTPFMSTKLECYPEEYKKHILFIDDYSSESIKNAIEKYMSSDYNKKIQFGEQARKFVFENKLKEHQVEKIKQLLKQNIKKGD